VHRRPHLSLLAGLALLGGIAGCTHDVQATPPANASDPACKVMAGKLPSTLLKAHRRSTDPSSPALAAWGDPAIILRCGVPTPGPTTEHCETVDGIDWVVRQLSGGEDFTTYGRTPAVQVLVPDHYAPEEFALTGLTPAIATIQQSAHRCS
jgi:hypothetical protein